MNLRDLGWWLWQGLVVLILLALLVLGATAPT